MIHQIFAIYDAKAGAFMQPFFSVNEGTALRAVRAAMEDGNSQLAKFPEDYQVFKVGQFDDEKGRIVGVDLPNVIAPLASLKERQDG